jgi:hypothetical protein
MKRIHSERPKVRRERTWLEVLALNPRDADIVRAKAIDHSATAGHGTTPVHAPERDKEAKGT